MVTLGNTLADLGDFIRQQRSQAQVSLRQLAQRAGVSNPYLSQIERGLRKPSAEVLRQIATALRISTPAIFLRAGLLQARDDSDVPLAIATDSALTERQKAMLLQIYEQFRTTNDTQAQTDATTISAEVFHQERTSS